RLIRWCCVISSEVDWVLYWYADGTAPNASSPTQPSPGGSTLAPCPGASMSAQSSSPEPTDSRECGTNGTTLTSQVDPAAAVRDGSARPEIGGRDGWADREIAAGNNARSGDTNGDSGGSDNSCSGGGKGALSSRENGCRSRDGATQRGEERAGSDNGADRYRDRRRSTSRSRDSWESHRG
ncbi:unnamed protein product, partial [Sphacelaria rigidula]